MLLRSHRAFRCPSRTSSSHVLEKMKKCARPQCMEHQIISCQRTEQKRPWGFPIYVSLQISINSLAVAMAKKSTLSTSIESSGICNNELWDIVSMDQVYGPLNNSATIFGARELIIPVDKYRHIPPSCITSWLNVFPVPKCYTNQMTSWVFINAPRFHSHFAAQPYLSDRVSY